MFDEKEPPETTSESEPESAENEFPVEDERISNFNINPTKDKRVWESDLE